MQIGEQNGLTHQFEYGQHSHTAWNQVQEILPQAHLRSLTVGLVLASDDRVRRESIGT